MLKRFIFPILLIIIGIAGVCTPCANLPVFIKFGEILPRAVQIAPIYQMVFGLVAVIGFIGIIEVLLTGIIAAKKNGGKNE